MRVSVPWPALTSVALALLATFGAGCAESPTTPTNTAPFSQTDLRVGTGDEAESGRLLTVEYTGWLYDATRPEQKGLRFDSSEGREPLVFRLGSGQVIAGWDLGFEGMRVGGLRRLVIPAGLAYGPARNGPIPPNSTLVFDVELVSVDVE